jgi:hypothetical protein
MSNLFQCKHCRFFVIAEELERHECKRLKESRTSDNILWITDGERWYPLKLSSPKREHPKFTPEDGTEPTAGINIKRKNKWMAFLESARGKP